MPRQAFGLVLGMLMVVSCCLALGKDIFEDQRLPAMGLGTHVIIRAPNLVTVLGEARVEAGGNLQLTGNFSGGEHVRLFFTNAKTQEFTIIPAIVNADASDLTVTLSKTPPFALGEWLQNQRGIRLILPGALPQAERAAQ